MSAGKEEFRFYIYSRSEDGTAYLHVGSTFTSWCTDRCEATGFLSDAGALAEATEYNRRIKAETRFNDAMRTRAMVVKMPIPSYAEIRGAK